MTRMMRVARVQLINAPMALGMPVLVLGFAVLITLSLFPVYPPEGAAPGTVLSLYGTMLVAHMLTMTQFFPFSVGMSVTRRAFFGATAVVIIGQSIGYGILLSLVAMLEKATGGWGMNVTMASFPFLAQYHPVVQFLGFAVPLVMLGFLGVWLGVVFQRWGQPGMYTVLLGVFLVLSACALLISWQGSWSPLGRFFTEQPVWVLLIGYPLLLSAVFVGGGYLTGRRAVP